MNPYLIMWPKSEGITHINYHYTQLGEIVDYLDKKLPIKGEVIDCDVQEENVMKQIKQKDIKKVVMNVTYENAKNAFELAEKIKEYDKNISVMAYGQVTTMLPKLFLDSKFDAIYRNGDPEICIESFLNDFECGKNITKEQFTRLKGLLLIKNKELITLRNGEFISNKEWGTSQEGRVPVKKYDEIKKKNRFVVNISRGCPYMCSHCLIQLTEGNKERRRDIGNLNESIGKIKKDYKHLKIWAANFTLNKEYVDEFCDMMIENHPEVTWEVATRINLVKDEKMLEKMKKAGCTQISLGIESLDNKKLIKTKNFSEIEVAGALKKIKKAGMQPKGCIMLGMPNQTKESIVKTIQFLMDNDVIIRPTIYTPYQNCNENTIVEELSNYNRKTYKNNNVPGITNEQLARLVKNPYEYKNILGIEDKEKNNATHDDDEDAR